MNRHTAPRLPRRGTARLAAAALLTSLLTLGGLIGAVPAGATTGTVSDTADETSGTNGRVSAILRIGTRIYIGGSFTLVDGVPRVGLAALDATTGRLDLGWRADLNPGGQALALAASPYGSTLYVGGAFTSIGGVARGNLAAVTTTTGAVTFWRPVTNYRVLALLSSPGKVFVGGSFTTIAGAAIRRLAQVDTAYGAPNAAFRPQPDEAVNTMRLTPSGAGLYIGGQFMHLGSTYRPHLGQVLVSNGAATAWYPEALGCPVLASVLSPAGTRLYVACAGFTNAVAAYNTGTTVPRSTRVWKGQADGNVQAVTLLGSTVYAGGHFDHMNGLVRHKAASFDYATGVMQPWNPAAIDSVLGIFAMFATTDALWMGGDFTKVGPAPHPHLARFRQIS